PRIPLDARSEDECVPRLEHGRDRHLLAEIDAPEPIWEMLVAGIADHLDEFAVRVDRGQSASVYTEGAEPLGEDNFRDLGNGVGRGEQRRQLLELLDATKRSVRGDAGCF